MGFRGSWRRRAWGSHASVERRRRVWNWFSTCGHLGKEVKGRAARMAAPMGTYVHDNIFLENPIEEKERRLDDHRFERHGNDEVQVDLQQIDDILYGQ